MSGNQTLAGYDMVLGLSEPTINFQFSMLHRRKIIHNDWILLAGNLDEEDAEPYVVDGDDADFKAKRDRWIELQRQIANESKYALIQTLQEEGISFDMGWDAKVGPPVVTVKDKDTQNLTLQIGFRKGTLYYRKDRLSEVKSYDLKGCVYAFQVPIGKLKIEKDRMVMDAQDEMERVIRESGLSADDFTIESLFLNFENANIALFDNSISSFPKEVGQKLQVAIQNYFNLIVADSDNPYVLGYGVSRKRIASSETAMFQPTSVHFSTSFSSRQNPENPVEGQFSSLNFLMMLNNHEPAYDQNTGVLPRSLIELGKDQSSTTDGVFAIQRTHFERYIASIDDYVESMFKKQDGVDTQGGFKNGVMTAVHHGKHVDDTIDTTYTLTRQTVENVDNPAGLKVTYRFEIAIRVGIHIGRDWEIHHVELSTGGKYTHGDIKQAGTVGWIAFTIKNADEGRFDLGHKITQPVIAFDKDPKIIGRGDFWQWLADILAFVFTLPAKIAEGIVNQIAVDLGRGHVAEQSELVKRLQSLDVLNQTNKVILPLGQVYTFKNLRMLSAEDIVAYDISYAPVHA